jgi:hypothetical protein
MTMRKMQMITSKLKVQIAAAASPRRMLAVLAIITVMFLFLVNDRSRSRCIYVLPKGYNGVITVRYNVKGARAIPIVNGVRKLIIPPSGTYDTSSKDETGLVRDHYYFGSISPDNELWQAGDSAHGRNVETSPIIFGPSSGSSSDSPIVTEQFYVGTTKQLNEYLRHGK